MMSPLPVASRTTPRRASTLLLGALMSLTLAACGDGCDPGPDPDGGPLPSSGGDGEIIRDGETTAYTFNPDDARFLITVHNKSNQIGCGLFHNHVVRAESLSLDFSLDTADAAGSTMSATVAAVGLQPDDPDLRQEILGDGPLSESDIEAIKESVYDQINAVEHATLTFEASNFSTLEAGTGTVDVAVTVGGASQTITMDYDLSVDGDNYTFSGTGTLPGGPHDIPSGFASDCVESDMGLILDLTLVPGTSDNPDTLDAGTIEAFEETFFPYEGECNDSTVSFNEVRDVLVRKCAGCHASDVRLGATTSLVDYEDFRVDTSRNPGVPTYETIAAYIDPEGDHIAMPPSDAAALTNDEKQLALLWIQQGGPDCLDNADPVVFAPVAPVACGPVAYEDVSPIIANNCVFCHDSDQDALARLETYADGLEDNVHEYYGLVNVWEVSLHRMEDETMPPYGGMMADDIALFRSWIEGGYPEVHCD